MPFVYFIGGETRPQLTAAQLPPTLAHLAGAGLGYRKTGSGPSGGHGLLMSDKGAVEYLPAKQTWRKMADKGWIGFETLPTPHDLMRDEIRAGQNVRLADGRQWLVPVARMVTGGGQMSECQLPRKRSLGPDGRWVAGSVTDRHADLWAAAEKWWNKKYAILEQVAGAPGASVEFSLEDETQSAVCALATNYRVGAFECDLLGLFDDTSVMAVLDALCDLVSFDVMLSKKSTAAEPSPTPAA